ncbi:MAG: general secretion pathway protein GspE [Deltaproteobacteria bacterium]|nr:general secretion pathway protein GspE [Deltaproteobacteria bacterium]
MQPFSGIALFRPGLLAKAAQAAVLRGVPASIEYDERLPIPPELLNGVLASQLGLSDWFPVIKDGDGTIVIAAHDPSDSSMRSEVEGVFGSAPYEFRVALPDDISWYIQDFLHAKPGLLIGTERTGLAFWRNTMGHWRTRLACYRTDLARARTALAFVRVGLALVAIFRTLSSSQRYADHPMLASVTLATGLLLLVASLPTYLRVRRSRLSPPRDQTLVEVTGATLSFLENYQNLKQEEQGKRTKETMLARLGDLLGNYCTILYPSPPSRERTHLARERNVLAAQRTIAGCYRNIYARARTGLAFIRTGVAFMSIGIGLIGYFGLELKTFFDAILIIIGLLMIIDGGLWYLPVRKEQAELPRTRSAVLAG